MKGEIIGHYQSYVSSLVGFIFLTVLTAILLFIFNV